MDSSTKTEFWKSKRRLDRVESCCVVSYCIVSYRGSCRRRALRLATSAPKTVAIVGDGEKRKVESEDVTPVVLVLSCRSERQGARERTLEPLLNAVEACCLCASAT